MKIGSLVNSLSVVFGGDPIYRAGSIQVHVLIES